MTILRIYKIYSIPQNLQLHMLRVAAVGKSICDHSLSQDLDTDLIVKTLLLHDMGNILKFDFNNPSLFAVHDQSQIQVYKETQISFKQKYGNNVDKATLQIIKEISADNRVAQLCEHSHAEAMGKYIDGEFWHEKICYYADMRIGLNGALTVDKRFEDLKKRYPRERKEMNQYHTVCKIIEKQIQKICTLDLGTINDGLLEKQFNALRSIIIN